MPPPIPKPIAPVVAPIKRAPRVRLADATSGVIQAPTRVLLFGVEGIGKSTFAAGAPGAIFFGAEDGTRRIQTTRFPTPKDADGNSLPVEWTDMLDAIDQLTEDPHPHKTMVIDTVDWLEPILHTFICKRDGKDGIEDYGFGKGYVAALDQWRILLSRLDRMSTKRGMHVILLGHAEIKTYKNPEGEDFDRFVVSVNQKASGLMKQWADAVLFANYETFAIKSKKAEKAEGLAKGVSSGRRLIYTERTAAYDAKNRYDLPAQLPLEWDAFWEAVTASVPRTLAEVTTELVSLVARVPEAARAKVQEQIDAKAGNVPALERYAAALRDKLGAEQAA